MRGNSVWLSLLCVLAAQATAEEAKLRINVGATIPSRPCQYPKPCRPVLGAQRTSATIAHDDIRYTGSAPVVEQQDGLLVVRF